MIEKSSHDEAVKMWWPLYLTLLMVFLLCSWFWNVGLPRHINSQEVITTNVEVNLIQQAALMPSPLRANYSGERSVVDARGERRNNNHVVPRFMLELYRQFTEDRGGRKLKPTVDIIRSFTPKNTASVLNSEVRFHGRRGERRHLLVFDVPAPGAGEVLETAELRILTVLQGTQRSRLGVERLVRVSVLDDFSDVDIPAQQVFHHDDAWVTFNMTSVLRRRNTRKRTTLRLTVHVIGVRDGEVDMAVGTAADLQPLLLLSYSMTKSPDPPHSRRKRSSEPEDYEEETNNLWDDDLITSRVTPAGAATGRKLRRMRNMCRRRPLYVDFSEIHYDSWIVAPNGYEAFQCMGKCFFPVGEHLSPTKHAIVQTLLHSVAPGKVSRACCVPTRLEPISVLYVDQRGVLTYRFSYQDMVVAECGCR